MNQNVATHASDEQLGKTAIPDGKSSSTSVYATGAFWERLWRTSGSSSSPCSSSRTSSTAINQESARRPKRSSHSTMAVARAS